MSIWLNGLGKLSVFYTYFISSRKAGLFTYLVLSRLTNSLNSSPYVTPAQARTHPFLFYEQRGWFSVSFKEGRHKVCPYNEESSRIQTHIFSLVTKQLFTVFSHIFTRILSWTRYYILDTQYCSTRYYLCSLGNYFATRVQYVNKKIN